jgi:hypothetical protein
MTAKLLLDLVSTVIFSTESCRTFNRIYCPTARVLCRYSEPSLWRMKSQSQSYLKIDGQSASLSWCQVTIRALDQFFFLLEIVFRQLRVCYFVAPSLARGQVCNLLLLLVLASAVPRDSRPYSIVPILETPPTWRARSQYLNPPGTGWPRYTPGHWVPFPSPLTTRRATVELF